MPKIVTAEEIIFYDTKLEYESITERGINQNLNIFTVNDSIGYSLDPNQYFTNVFAEKDYDYMNNNYTEEQIEYIKMLINFGYNTGNKSNEKYYMATQELIWEYLTNEEVSWTYKHKPCNIEKYKNEILESIANLNIKPSFDLENIQGNYNEKIVLIDTNGVLSNYEIINDSKNIIQKYNNALTIIIKDSNKIDIILKQESGSGLENCAYLAYESATIITTKLEQEVISKISIEMKEVTGSNINLVNNIEGILKFKIKNLDSNEYINEQEIFLTDNKGNYKSNFKLEPGKYQLEIVEQPLKYKKIQNLNFEIENTEITIKNNIEALKGNILIKRYGKSEELKPLSNIKYYVYSQEDIVSNNKTIYKKDELIKIISTNDFGIAKIDDLYLGKYYIIEERNSILPYIIEQNKYYLELKPTDVRETNLESILEISSNQIKLGINILTKEDGYTINLSDNEYNYIKTIAPNELEYLDLNYGKYILEIYYYKDLIEEIKFEFNETNNLIQKEYNQENIIFEMPITGNNKQIIKYVLVLIDILTVLTIVIYKIKKQKNDK